MYFEIPFDRHFCSQTLMDTTWGWAEGGGAVSGFDSICFLGAFEKLEKKSDCWLASRSVRTEQLGSHWTDFNEIRYLSIFRKYVEGIEVS